MADDPTELIQRIQGIQMSLRDLQMQVIRGEIKPDDYQRIERERIAEIHHLEEALAKAGGEAVPERETDSDP